MNFDCFQPYGDRFTDEDIRQIETTIDATLPDDYRTFLIERGGGSIIGNVRIGFAGMDNDVFILFGKKGALDLDPRTSGDLRLGDELDHYPPNSLVIADSIFGHPYFGVFRDGTMEIRWMGYLEVADSLHVASSFTAFLEMIDVTPHDDAPPSA